MRSTSRNIICEKQPSGGGRRAVFLCAGMGSFAPPGASSFLSSLKESYQRKPLETTFQDFLSALCPVSNLPHVPRVIGFPVYRCRSKGLCLRSPARRLPRPLASATVGAFSSAGLGEFRRCGGELAFPWRGGGLRRPHFFLRRKKCGKESRLDLRSKDPLARCGSCRFGGMHSRMKCSG